MDTTRTQLKTLNSQMDFFIKQKVAARTSLISFMDMTCLGMDSLLSDPVHDDGSEKQLDYAESFWYVGCIRKIGLEAFTERYQTFYKRNRYNFQPGKPEELCLVPRELVAVYLKDRVYRDFIMTEIEQPKSTARHVERIRHKMDALAPTLPKYEAVLPIRGVDKILGPQLMAEIGDTANYTHRKTLTAFAGVDPGANESGSFRSRSNLAPKCGSSRLRKMLFLIMTSLLQTSPADDRVYQFLG